jgi:hypothetical protein
VLSPRAITAKMRRFEKQSASYGARQPSRKRIVQFWRRNKKWCTMSCTCLDLDKTWRIIGVGNVDAQSGLCTWFYMYNMYYNTYYSASYALFYSSSRHIPVEVARGVLPGIRSGMSVMRMSRNNGPATL